MFETSVTLAHVGALMGTPTAAGFHSQPSGGLKGKSGIEREKARERESQSRSVMGIHVPDTHSFIDLR